MDLHRILAFDLGAESGRAVVGTLQDGRLSLEEISRFPNEPVEVSGTLYWDVLALYNNILKGLREYTMRCGDIVDSIGIDTWGVDFGLLDQEGNLLQNPVHYRDRRTEGMLDEIQRRIAPEDLFQHTGMALSLVSTSAQLLSLRLNDRPFLESAATLLMMPNLLTYFLTGQKSCERTDAVSTQLYDPQKCQWSDEVFRSLDLPRSIMPQLVDPGTLIGELPGPLGRRVGLKRAVVTLPCTHDTTSAAAAVPGKGEDWAFLSSGTWSVVGALTDRITTSPEAFSAGVCNNLTFRSFFLSRYTMGLWLLQQVRKVWQQQGEAYSYMDLVKLAERAPEGGPLIDPDDPTFLAPEDMTSTIREYCAKTGQRRPGDAGEMARCILESLAQSYRYALDQMGQILGRRFRTLHIVGGGSHNSLLCQFAANATGVPIWAGPTEATVAGNVLVQALAIGCVTSPQEIRDIVRASSNLVEYHPQDRQRWQDDYGRYLRILERGKG